MLYTLLMPLLAAMLPAAGAYFAVMALRQRKRSRTLSRRAHEMGMRFALDDPFDLPRRCRHFALMSGGHSCQAANVAYGWHSGLLVRAFDYRHELGHGTQRSTRHYAVVVVQAPVPMPEAMLWHKDDNMPLPMPLRSRATRLGNWLSEPDVAPAAAMAEACAALDGEPVSVQVHAATVMFCMPVSSARHDALRRLPEMMEIVAKMPGALAVQHERAD